MRDYLFIKCPKCHSIMYKVEEVHTELDSYPNKEVWWECGECGTAISDYGDDDIYNPYEDEEWDRAIRKVYSL